MNRHVEASDLNLTRVGPLIRARRHKLKWTLNKLGEAAGISVGYLSQVERDQALPSLSTLAAIARALDVGVDYFIASPRAQDALTRAGERMRFSVSDPLIAYEKLHTEFPGNILSSFLITIQPGYRSEPTSHEGEEAIYVLDGVLTLTIDGDIMKVGAGDSFHFRGNRTHFWANESDGAVRLIWSGTLAMFHSSKSRSPFNSGTTPWID